jgi:alpha-L-rhamnosidase
MARRLLVWLFFASFAHAAPVHLRCEYLENPLGIGTATPQLSWQSDSTQRNWRQTAYEILVASSVERLRDGDADVWDSGRRNSAESVGILYAGPKLKSGERYYWSVRVWDASGQVSELAQPAWWEMGLLENADWQAKWITWTNPEEEADRASLRWVWVAGQDASSTIPKTVAVFRLNVKLSQKPRNAALFIIARGDFRATVNGQEVTSKSRWSAFDRKEVGDRLVVGKNSIEVTVTVPEHPQFEPDPGDKTMKSAMAALLKITREDGTVRRWGTVKAWKARLEDHSKWLRASVVAGLDDAQLGADSGLLPQPAALLRRSFAVSKQVQAARLYATALGSYRMFINGNRVGQDVLTPGFTDYRKRVLYQVYDVTSALKSGQNTIGAVLGDGWFGSSLTWTGAHFFRPPKRLLARLKIDYADGTHESILTDESWKAAQSPILHSEIYAGEVYDARLQQPDWNKPGFDDTRWAPAIASETPAIVVSSEKDLPTQVVETVQPKSVTSGANGSYVFDMGQNMVGWVTLKVSGAPGTVVRLRFAEILRPDGNIYRENLRNADATDTYILRGSEEETFAPYFTFHGFRYVEVTGYPGQPALGAITGDVVSSIAGRPTGILLTSSPLVNRMWSIGLWGQRGNFLSIPTDCPQRDERLGWMGDAEVFWRTGSYNYDIAAFSKKWIDDVADAQTAAGAFTNVSPDVLPAGGDGSIGAPGWGDAGVIVSYTAWLQYGDQQIVKQNWDAMQRWMTFIQNGNPDFLRKQGVGPNFADWLAPDENTDKDLLATAYWALIANMMSEMAHAIGQEDDATRYASLVQNIRSAFQKAYVKDDGKVGTGTQTSYVVALYTKMAPQPLEPAMVSNLVKDIEARNWHLSTGFLGTPFLLFTLANHGRADVAYRLLLNETYPSWGYMLSKGATTWWERWNGDTGDPAMNSYNHYAFGSVMAWVYRYVAGIDTTLDGPGFHQIIIHPRLDSRLDQARGEYDSAYGKIVSDWRGTPEGPFSLQVTIPPNTAADVYLPVIANTQLIEDGQPITARQESGSYVVQVGSGSYEFRVK